MLVVFGCILLLSLSHEAQVRVTGVQVQVRVTGVQVQVRVIGVQVEVRDIGVQVKVELQVFYDFVESSLKSSNS